MYFFNFYSFPTSACLRQKATVLHIFCPPKVVLRYGSVIARRTGVCGLNPSISPASAIFRTFSVEKARDMRMVGGYGKAI